MDNPKEGYLLIGTTMLLLLVFVVAILLLMLIYRRRKMEHAGEVATMKEKYEKEMFETQLTIQQDIMQEIGREIHDNVGQRLTLAALYAEHLNLAVGKEGDGKLGQIAELLHESLHDLRNLSQHLIAPNEKEQSLLLLLQKEVKKANLAEMGVIHLQASGVECVVSLKTTNMILRIVQEFLQNSLKHAACKQITVQADFSEQGLLLELSDDGKGFSTNDMPAVRGVGLVNMNKRASLINADYKLTSSPGNGTQVRVLVPAKSLLL